MRVCVCVHVCLRVRVHVRAWVDWLGGACVCVSVGVCMCVCVGVKACERVCTRRCVSRLPRPGSDTDTDRETEAEACTQRAERAGGRAPAGGADDDAAAGLGELDRREPHAAARAVHQARLAGARARRAEERLAAVARSGLALRMGAGALWMSC